MKWQKINSAPKDATYVWLFEETTKKQWMGAYNKYNKSWICDGISPDGTTHWIMEIFPTHWMPLPEEPDEM